MRRSNLQETWGGTLADNLSKWFSVHLQKIQGTHWSTWSGTSMLSHTFPLSEANKEVFWEEKGMQFPQHASPVVTNHKSSYNPKPWRKIGEGLCCHWWMFYNRVLYILQLMFIFRGTTSFLWSDPEGCSIIRRALIGACLGLNVCRAVDVTPSFSSCYVNKQAVILGAGNVSLISSNTGTNIKTKHK